MTEWEKFFDEKIRLVAQRKQVWDIGGGFKFQKGLAAYQRLFVGCDYRVLDKDPSHKPDMIGDIQNLSQIPDNRAEAIICKAVLEHVENPVKAAEELFRVLKPGGVCLIYVPFLYVYHARKGGYGDFYRYTLDGLRWLFRRFSSFEYCPVRGRWETIAYLLPTQFARRVASRAARVLDLFYKTDYQSSGYYAFLVK